ncbi:MAG: hypothetical protein KBD21_03030 [Candidatus Pacebacteria bacterium]|nr:hypothetical protein [Candidatus Paceibacterota bacterium]
MHVCTKNTWSRPGLLILTVLGFCLPTISHALTFKEIVTGTILPLVDSAVALFVTLAVVVFVFGMVRFIATAGDEKSRSSGKVIMTWGLVALFVMVSVWGIVKIMYTTIFG